MRPKVLGICIAIYGIQWCQDIWSLRFWASNYLSKKEAIIGKIICTVRTHYKPWLVRSPSKNEKIGKKYYGLCCRAACITRNFFKTQNTQLINESGFKLRAANDGMVYEKRLSSSWCWFHIWCSLQFKLQSWTPHWIRWITNAFSVSNKVK